MSDNVNAAFLKDALAVIENVHKQFAGKLVSFLVNKYLIGPHLSLTRYRGSPHRTVPHRTDFSIRRFLKYFNSSHSTDYYVIKFHIVRFLQYLYTL